MSERALREAVAELAFPRLAGGAGERRAADLVAARFAAAGLDVSREEFRASRTAMSRLRFGVQGTVAAGTALFAALAAAGFSAAWVAGVVTLGFALFAGTWRRGMERAFDVGPMITSANVIGRRPAPGPTLRLVFLAHLDSKSSRLPTFWTSVVAIAVMVWLIIATITSAFAGWNGGTVSAAVPAVGWVLALLLLVVSDNPTADESPGAMDNAAGLAVLLDLARSLPEDPALAAADLTFLATGAEEFGLCGAMRWIQAHEAELDRRRTVFVNIDSVGVGRRLLAVDVRGRGPDGRPMRDWVREVSRTEGARLQALSFLPGVGVDTMPIGARGFATVSILGDVLGSPSRRIHSRRDTVDHVSEAALQAAARYARGLAGGLGTSTRTATGGSAIAG